MKVKELEKTTPELIKEYLERYGTKQIWLAQQTGLSPEHISNILADRVLLTEENLKKINDALGTKF
jgi:antitoxin component HigA of HigAB toxin-antitoxin module